MTSSVKTPLKRVNPSRWERDLLTSSICLSLQGWRILFYSASISLEKSSSKAFHIPAKSLFHFTSEGKCYTLKPLWLVSLVEYTQDYFLIAVFNFIFSGVDFLSTFLITPLPVRFKSFLDATIFPPLRCLYSVIKSLLSSISDKLNRLCYKAH